MKIHFKVDNAVFSFGEREDAIANRHTRGEGQCTY
jgi:hypothetical protein